MTDLITANNDEVICPNCCCQFRAIPVNVQQLMLDAGFEPPFTAALRNLPDVAGETDMIPADQLFVCGQMGAHVTRVRAAPQPAADAERAFISGWLAAARWANRDDLIADVGSPAWIRERDAAMAAAPEAGK